MGRIAAHLEKHMIKKLLIASALGLSVVTAGPLTAHAGVDLDVKVIIGVGGYGKNISCATGKRVVARHFNKVKVVECAGTTYRYIGYRKGKRFMVRVDGRAGHIKSVDRY